MFGNFLSKLIAPRRLGAHRDRPAEIGGPQVKAIMQELHGEVSGVIDAEGKNSEEVMKWLHEVLRKKQIFHACVCENLCFVKYDEYDVFSLST